MPPSDNRRCDRINRGIGKLKTVVIVRGSDDDRASFVPELMSAFTARLGGEVEADVIGVPDGAAESASARNDFKRAVLNHRKAVIVECRDDGRPAWKRFQQVAMTHSDISFVWLVVDLGARPDPRLSGIGPTMEAPTAIAVAISLHDIVTGKKQ